jgi:hypothetical protein
MADPIQRYNAVWPGTLTDLQIELAAIKYGGYWTTKGKMCGDGLSTHFENARRIIWPELDGEHNGQRWHKLCRDAICAHKVSVLMGPGCIDGKTRLLNPLTGEQPTVEFLYRNRIAPMVMTLDGPRKASVPFIKGIADLYEVVLENGNRFTVTAKHRVLTPSAYVHVESLQIGQSLVSYAPVHQRSISDNARLTHAADAPSWLRTIADWKDHCSAYCHPCDAPLHRAQENGQSFSPSQACAPKYTGYASCQRDGSGNGQGCIHFHPPIGRLSSSDASPSLHQLSDCDQLHNGEETCSPAYCSFLPSLQPLTGKHHLESSGKPTPCSFHIGSSVSVQSEETQSLALAAQSLRMPFQSQKPSQLMANLDSAQTLPSFVDYAARSFSDNEIFSRGLLVQVSKVVSITWIKKDIFFDLSVPGPEHYFAEGAVHHNSSGKTHEAAWIYLMDYFADPENTCVLVSSTDRRGLKLRVWGEIASLWEKAVAKFPFLPGHMLDSALAITTEDLDDTDIDDRKVRDMRKGIIGIPTMVGSRVVGLSKWIGCKQKRVRLIADEASLMGASFLSAFSNLNKNEDFRAIVLGNPNDILDPLGRAAEPIDGWDDHMEPTKTSTWKTRFMNGICVNLIGTDSPNFDFPADKPTRFKYLISREKIAETLSFFPKDSFEYYSQCVGCMKIGAMARRVLTRRMCEQGEALKTDVIWKNSNRIRVYFVDAGYGGDRCVAGWAEFGHDMNGKLIFMAHPPAIIPISMTANKEPEQQIAEYVKEDCESLGIPPGNMGHDATGRGSLGTYLARVWSAQTNPIESGGNPTDRPVDQDTYIIDPKTKVRRLKTCKEAYVKLVTEFWFSVRLAVQAGQVRGMTEEVMEEFCMREWENVAGDRKMVEAKKEMKERIGRSPDLGDFFSGALEMARRKGFLISKLSNESVVSNANSNWLENMKHKQELLLKKQQLSI